MAAKPRSVAYGTGVQFPALEVDGAFANEDEIGLACIGRSTPPGGKWGEREGQPFEMNMFSDDRFADAFVETWRRIATRFRGNSSLYGYDLVNEPTQRGPVKHNYIYMGEFSAAAWAPGADFVFLNKNAPIRIYTNVKAFVRRWTSSRN